MICVSYTRLVSGCIEKINSYQGAGTEKKVSSLMPIADQNRIISQYAGKNHWKVSRKYSDRSSDAENETVFLQMAEDGIARRFDMVILYSMFFFGRNISSAGDLLRDVFYPAGIQFAVAEDDFCSIGKTETEVMSYLKGCRSRYRKSMHSQLCASYSEACRYKYYGYIWQPDGSLIINEEAAAVVRRIFEMFRQGMIIKDVAAALNKDLVETPMQYRARVTGKSNAFEKGCWKNCTVRSLISKNYFTGTWVRKIGGENIIKTCPVIIPEEEYQEVAMLIASRSNTSEPRNERCKAYFSKHIFDADTGEKLRANKKLTKGIEVYCPDVDIQSVVVGEGKNIPADNVLQAVLQRLSEERMAAQRAKSYLLSEQAKEREEEIKEPVRDKMRTLLYQMSEVEEKLQEEPDNQVLEQMMQELEKRMADAEVEMERLDRMFSSDNPWITLFSSFNENSKFTEVFFKKYLHRIEVRNFSEVEVFLNLQEWKLLPQDLKNGERLCQEKAEGS